MNDIAYQPRCEAAATGLLRQAMWPSVIAAVGMACLPLLPWSQLLLQNFTIALLAVLAAFAVFALSALLVFDALLFRLMASHPDDATGGAAVDDLLARMRLKARPPTLRPLQERIDGANGLLRAQRAAFAIFAVAWLATAWQIG